MDAFKRLVSRHPAIFTLLGLAFAFDTIFMLMTGSLWQNASYAAGSVLVIVYFLGLSYLLRFAVVGHRLHLGLAWVAIILMFFAWFVIQTVLQDGHYKPSFLFLLCLVTAFKTIRFDDASQAEDSRDLQGDIGKSPEIVTLSVTLPVTKNIVDAPLLSTSEQETEPEATSSDSKPRKTESGSLESKLNGLLNLKTALVVLASLGCLLALADMPDNFYKVLRFVVVAASLAVIWDVQKSQTNEKKKTAISIAFGLLAVIFNPILPLEMERGAWAWFDVIGCILFLAAQGEVFFRKVAKGAFVACLVLGFGWGVSVPKFTLTRVATLPVAQIKTSRRPIPRAPLPP